MNSVTTNLYVAGVAKSTRAPRSQINFDGVELKFSSTGFEQIFALSTQDQ